MVKHDNANIVILIHAAIVVAVAVLCTETSLLLNPSLVLFEASIRGKVFVPLFGKPIASWGVSVCVHCG